jgi:hypothetical protein
VHALQEVPFLCKQSLGSLRCLDCYYPPEVDLGSSELMEESLLNFLVNLVLIAAILKQILPA